MTTNTDLANVPMPDGAVLTEGWEPAGYCVFEGTQRYINESISVWIHGLQHADGSIDDGTNREAPGHRRQRASLGGRHRRRDGAAAGRLPRDGS
jgi:hypothetical protein